MKTTGRLLILAVLGLALSLSGGWAWGSGPGLLGSASAQGPDQDNPHYFPLVARTLTGPPPPNTTPLPSTSYYFYMRVYTPAKARAEGCKLGTRDRGLPGAQDSVVILDFGLTKYQGGQYGASGMVVGGFVTLPVIAQAVQEFGLGYWQCTGEDYSSHLQIGIGTNNYNNADVYSNLAVTYGHGRAWAEMVNSANDWFVNECPDACNGQVDAVGANDIELAWSAPQAAIEWLSGYDSANQTPLINFGAAEGCPNACGGGGYSWTKQQVWTVHNSGPVSPMPEIYLNDGRNAQQWYQMSLYSVQAHGLPYDFYGVMTTWGACQQEQEAACEFIDNTPEEGWTQLYSLVNGATMSTWDSIPYVTDIMWWE
jgi:hypothetical protein